MAVIAGWLQSARAHNCTIFGGTVILSMSKYITTINFHDGYFFIWNHQLCCVPTITISATIGIVVLIVTNRGTRIRSNQILRTLVAIVLIVWHIWAVQKFSTISTINFQSWSSYQIVLHRSKTHHSAPYRASKSWWSGSVLEKTKPALCWDVLRSHRLCCDLWRALRAYISDSDAFDIAVLFNTLKLWIIQWEMSAYSKRLARFNGNGVT